MSVARTHPRVGPACHGAATTAPDDPGTPVVALVGAPNVGKSTLFNALTGSRRDVGNWPGTTVEVGRGCWQHVGPGGCRRAIGVIDLPGAYSLDPLSPDEQLTRRLLLDVPAAEQPDVVVVVVDATSLARSLYLVAQLRERPRRLAVVVTMADVAARRGRHVDLPALAEALGVPCVALDPRHGPVRPVVAALVDGALGSPAAPARHLTDPVDADVPADPEDAAFAAAEERFGWVTEVVSGAVTEPAVAPRTWTDRIDAVATSPLLGGLAFLVVMAAVFQVTTRVAAPLQALLGELVAGPVSAAVGRLVDRVGLGGTWVRGLLLDGVVAGVGMLLTFVPLMALMFGLLALLEDSGYMARAAVVTDRLMRTIGLPGRAFLPLVVGFGCNVPAVMGTRALPDARHRLLTVLLVPFTSCSARLTVYVLVATTFFGSQAGTVVFGMYLLSIVLVVLVGLLLRVPLLGRLGSEPLVLDLPPYHRPHLRLVLTSAWIRVQGFLRTAGGIVVATVVAVWALSSVPVDGGSGFGEVPVADSAYAAAAGAVAPVFAPAGFGDWHTASALMTGFVAKEAVVSSWAQTYAAGEPSAGPAAPDTTGAAGTEQPQPLADRLRADFDRSSQGHPTAAALAFLVLLLAYTPCVATLAAQLREVGVGWTAAGMTLQLAVGWLLAVAVFQVGRLL